MLLHDSATHRYMWAGWRPVTAQLRQAMYSSLSLPSSMFKEFPPVSPLHNYHHLYTKTTLGMKIPKVS